MRELFFPAVLLLGAFAAAILPVLALLGAVQATKKRSGGYMHLVPYGIMLTSALIVAYGGRDFSLMMTATSAAKPALLTWVQRVFTLVMLLAAAERLGSYVLGTRDRQVSTPLALSFAAFWLGSTLLPVFLGKNSQFTHEIFYSLLIGLAALTITAQESQNVVIAARNAVVLFTLASWAALIVAPHQVMETGYSQGFLPGIPRFAGLAAHAVALGMLVQIGIFCLWAHPFRKKFVNWVAWTGLIAALVMSQAKTAWLSTLICTFALLYVRNNGQITRSLMGRRRPLLGVIVITTGTIAAVGITLLVFMKVQTAIDFLSTQQGAQLASFTGRDVIWAAALEEWQKYPLFGYGTELFSVEHRLRLGMPQAVHGHNQLIDTLGRSGLAGAIPFVIYLSLLGYFSFKYRHATHGLSLVLFLALFFRGISEIPFHLIGYGHEFLTHILLLAVLAAGHRKNSKSALAKSTLAEALRHLGPSDGKSSPALRTYHQ